MATSFSGEEIKEISLCNVLGSALLIVQSRDLEITMHVHSFIIEQGLKLTLASMQIAS
jgi:hypothetical protein